MRVRRRPATPAVGGEAVPLFEQGADGQPLRTEHGMDVLLARHGLQRYPSKTFGQNNCLVDSMLLSMKAAGLVRVAVSESERCEACTAARQHLEQQHGLVVSVPPPFLSHDEHAGAVFDFLRQQRPNLWVDVEAVRQVELTMTVYDRFNGRCVLGARGETDELVPTPPVRVAPLELGTTVAPQHAVQIQLYSNTHRDGTGYHFEWVGPRPADDSH